ncbi:MAG: hydrogenase maturation nickel metallochaperone HypA [Chitinispirillaceae bacterium]|nr:hydrogenase maturation nickel metallochaperone HypA [Chitinispirillaceae bacterium]
MHEYGIALEISRLALRTAGNRRILKINLRIGELSGVFFESLAMYLECIFNEQQNAAPAISVERAAARFKCSCGVEYAPDKLFSPCPSCGGFTRTVIDGKECTIESIEVEDG